MMKFHYTSTETMFMVDLDDGRPGMEQALERAVKYYTQAGNMPASQRQMLWNGFDEYYQRLADSGLQQMWLVCWPLPVCGYEGAIFTGAGKREQPGYTVDDWLRENAGAGFIAERDTREVATPIGVEIRDHLVLSLDDPSKAGRGLLRRKRVEMHDILCYAWHFPDPDDAGEGDVWLEVCCPVTIGVQDVEVMRNHTDEFARRIEIPGR
jgi:hypothetical protein